MSRWLALLPVLFALALRLAGILASDRVVADVRIYHKVAQSVLAGAWNPYELPARFYPYPPVWVWIEAGSAWLARQVPAIGFAIWVKLPILTADLLIVLLLVRWGARRGVGTAPAWLFALHPVSLLITGVHGQFDSIALLFAALAVYWHEQKKHDRAALALCGGIAVKSFPVLLLPFFLVRSRSWSAALRFLVLAILPGALLLLPFALDNLPALRRELFGYGGFADFGWIGLLRGLRWMLTGQLQRSEPPHWGALIPIAKALYLSVYGLLLLGFARRRLNWRLADASLAVFVAFLALYGSVSAQYLVWVVPLAVLRPRGSLVSHAVTGSVALLGFYAFMHPAVLFPPSLALPFEPKQAGFVWVAGVAAVTVVCLVWLVALIVDGLQPPEDGDLDDGVLD